MPSGMQRAPMPLAADGGNPQALADSVVAGNRPALARLLTLIENQTQTGQQALAVLFSHSGQAHIVGITGAPGTGKSSLVNHLATILRHGKPAVGHLAVVAVDPSSPFSGGAILGDRIRMRELAGDPGVFIRSMASRGALGGLAEATSEVITALDAAGFQQILVETVGAGQAEVDIAHAAHTTIVVEAPGLGDDVQAIKAGILEIADILVLNKADLPGADNARRALQMALDLGRSTGAGVAGSTGKSPWPVRIIETCATNGEGVEQLAEEILAHQSYLRDSGELERRERARLQAQLDRLLQAALHRRFIEHQADGRLDEALEQVWRRKLSPRQAVEQLMAAV
jgi:LAO/AO transport system kinase